MVDFGLVPLRAADSQTNAKRVAIVQSSYIPWKGYFDLIRAVDHFILLDEVQFTKRDWRSRNRIKTKDGPAWLTRPPMYGNQTICSVFWPTSGSPELLATALRRLTSLVSGTSWAAMTPRMAIAIT